MKLFVRKFLFILAVQCISAANNNLLPEKSMCGYQIVNSNSELRRVAKEGEFPWLALLKYVGDNPFKCVGSLINERYILTSAVCVKSKHFDLTGVRLGEHILGNTTSAEEFGIAEKIPHENFKKGKKQYNNDIALLRLNGTVKYSDYIKPICLPLAGTVLAKPEDKVFISGWGKNISGEAILTKKVVIRRVISNQECQQAYQRHNITIAEDYICTHTLKDHKDFTCAGDGGAPIMVSNENRWHQEGIVSFGSLCGQDFPDGNTRVANYLNWILDHMRE